MLRTIDWRDGSIVIIDQCALPAAYRTVKIASVDELISAIHRLAIRGAPALGAAGALGVALAAHTQDAAGARAAATRVANARPTAVNLGWGVQRALAKLPGGPAAVLAEAPTFWTKTNARAAQPRPMRRNWCWIAVCVARYDY